MSLLSLAPVQVENLKELWSFSFHHIFSLQRPVAYGAVHNSMQSFYDLLPVTSLSTKAGNCNDLLVIVEVIQRKRTFSTVLWVGNNRYSV